MQATRNQQLGADRPTWGEWFKDLRVPQKPTIHADWVVIGLATVAQSFIVGFWSYTRFFDLERAKNIPGPFQLAFSIIAGLALDAAVIFSATSGLDTAPWNLNPKKGKLSLGGWATWTPFIAFLFSSMIAIDTFSTGWSDTTALLHIGWPAIVFALSKYGASLRAQRKASEAAGQGEVHALNRKLALVESEADARVQAANADTRRISQQYESIHGLFTSLVDEFKAAREQWAASGQRAMDEFRATRDQWDEDRTNLTMWREQAEMLREQERTARLEFTSTMEAKLQQVVNDVRAEERRSYQAEIARERLAWLGQLEAVNADWLVMNQSVQNCILEIDSLVGMLHTSKVFMKPSEMGAETTKALGKTGTLRKFFRDFFEEHGREPTNEEIGKALDWAVNTFDTLAGRVRGERKQAEAA
jgi:hypothetical protein